MGTGFAGSPRTRETCPHGLHVLPKGGDNMAELSPIILQMIDNRTQTGQFDDKRMLHEILQQIALAGLYR